MFWLLCRPGESGPGCGEIGAGLLRRKASLAHFKTYLTFKILYGYEGLFLCACGKSSPFELQVEFAAHELQTPQPLGSRLRILLLERPRFISPASDGGQPVQVYTIHGEEELCEDGGGGYQEAIVSVNSRLHRCRSTFLKFVDMTVWCIMQHPFPRVVSSCHNSASSASLFWENWGHRLSGRSGQLN